MKTTATVTVHCAGISWGYIDVIDFSYHTKPVQRSLELLEPYLEYVEGSTAGKFHIIPFTVKLTEAGAAKLGLSNLFICKRTELHKVAERAKQLEERP